MTRSSAEPSAIVVDASLAVVAVLPVFDQEAALDRFTAWHSAGKRLAAPIHWLAEAVSAIRKQVYLENLSAVEGERAVDDLFALGIDEAPLDRALCRAAFEWADRMSHARAYDGFYLALAEAQGASLWTADRRLAKRAGEIGLDWVHSI